jgi:acyl-CoA thioesterase-1
MRNAPALFRFVAQLIAVGVLVGGCGQTPPFKDPGADPGAGLAQDVHGRTLPAPAGAPGEPAAGEPVAAGPRGTSQLTAGPHPATLPAGSIYRNPANGRQEVIVEDSRRTAVLIGDSQSEPANAWPRQALAAAGYKVFFCGLGGTGFVAANGSTGNYLNALRRGDWKLPYGEPPLVVMQGGGNDAARGATDEQIASNAEQLIGTLRERYPSSKFAMIGTLARGANDGGGRRSQVDALLGTVAAKQAIPFVSVGDWLTRYKLTGMLADGVHLNAQGHNELGTLLGQRFKALGLEAKEPRTPSGS